MTTLSANQAAVMKEMEYMKESMTRIHARLDETHKYLKEITKDVSSIRTQNEGHEERLAMLQNLTASLGESIVSLDKSCWRLKRVSFGFIGLLIIMAVLVGLMGDEILPKVFSWLWALVGL